LHIETFKMATSRTMSTINLDWMPLLSGAKNSLVLGSILSLLTLLILCVKSVKIPVKIIICLLFVLSLITRRYALPLVVILIPEIIVCLTPPLNRMIRQLKEYQNIYLPSYIAIAALFLIIFARVAINISDMTTVYADRYLYAAYEPDFPYPAGAVVYLQKSGVPDRLLNDFNWGGYLIWNFPGHKFFIDGRMDAFFVDGKSFSGTYWNLTHCLGNWQADFAKYNFNAVLASVAENWKLVEVLKSRPDWRVVYADKVSILLLKNEN
jgi:hypothetical protein